MLSVRQFWERGLGKFSENDFNDKTTIFLLLLVHQDIKSGINLEGRGETVALSKKVYPFIFNYQDYFHPINKTKLGTIIYKSKKPRDILLSDVVNRRSMRKYVGEVSRDLFPGGLDTDLPCQKLFIYHYKLKNRNGKVTAFKSEICHYHVNDSERLAKMEKLAFDLSTSEEKFSIDRNITSFFPCGDNWLHGLFWLDTPKESFYKLGIDSNLNKDMVEELFDIYREGASFGYVDLPVELCRKINKTYPTFFVFNRIRDSEIIISKSPFIKSDFFGEPETGIEEDFSNMVI